MSEPRPQSGSPVADAFRSHGAALRRFVYRYARCPDDVDDILQEAFIRAYVAERARPIEQPKSFLFRIAKHVALSHLERSRLWHWAELDEDSLEQHSPEDEAIADEVVRGHLQAIDDLPPVCRQVYCLATFEDLSHKQVAAVLGVAVSTVEKHMIKASRRMPA